MKKRQVSTQPCACGCGKFTNIAIQTDMVKGWVKGQPQKYYFGHGNTPKPLSVHFWCKVDKEGPMPKHCPELGPCWVWLGWKDHKGYGRVWSADQDRDVYATHAAIFLETGKWPILYALHKCDNANCVRFSHLFEGTQQDNVNDMVAKGRHSHGDRHALKLTTADVLEIREKYASGCYFYKDLGTTYGIDSHTVGEIVRGEIWKHLLNGGTNEQ